MDDANLARSLHVFGVVLWIGGVGFVTTVLLPAIVQRVDQREGFELFEALEGRFAWQARATTLLVGLTGLYMLHAWDLWSRFADPAFWPLHAMVFVWAVYALMLFVLEPWFLHRWFRARAAQRPARTMLLVQRLHQVLLAASLITVLAGVAGAHGW